MEVGNATATQQSDPPSLQADVCSSALQTQTSHAAAPTPTVPSSVDASMLQLTVRNQEGSTTQFRIKKSTRLQKLMNVYCDRFGVQTSQVSFTAVRAKELILPDDTAEALGLENDDLIEAFHYDHLPT